MARKEINVFNVSFIDLLSGALGAVLILFVIVPKMDSEMRAQLEELDAFKELRVDVAEIKTMISKLEGSVDKSTMSKLEQKVELISTDVSTLQEKIRLYQTQLAKSESEKAQVEALNEDLQKQLEALRKQVKGNTDFLAENKKLQSQLSNVTQMKDSFESQLNALKKSQTNASSAVKELNDQLDKQQKGLKDCLDSKKVLEDAIADLRSKVDQMASENADLSKELKKNSSDKDYVKDAVDKMAEKIERLKTSNGKLKAENDQMTADVTKLQERLKKAQAEIERQEQVIAKAEKPKQGGAKVDKTGVKFNDKKIVFVVDVSGSMDDAPEPEKLDQVKAGLKMLVASMDDSYSIDIVIFPKSPTQDFDALYNRLAKVTDDQKYAIYRHLSPIFARNCTPTRSVLEHVLTDPAYKDAGTITFLSDGLPTKSVAGSTDCPEDPYREVLKFVRELNGGKRVINTIGVGSVYRNKASKDTKVVFMKEMAKQNKGFYIGF